MRNGAQQGNHGVCEVLADAAATDDGFVDGRVDTGRAGDVFEVVEEALIEFLHEHQGIITSADSHLRCQQRKSRRFDNELARQQHLPVIAGFDHRVECIPRIGREKAGNVGHRLLFNNGLSHDDELIVLAGNIEVVDIVAEVIAIREDAAARTDGERKGKAVLV